MTTHQTFYVTVEVDQDVPMPARIVGLGIEAGLAGAGFSGHVTVAELDTVRGEFGPDTDREEFR